VQWSQPAKAKLATLPPKVRRAILDKTKALADCDPRDAHKPLTGPLHGCYSIKVSRYRAIYTVREERLANGDTLLLVRVVVVAVGMRKAGDRHDVYALAERLIRFAGLEIEKPKRQ
jgi:mRNA-degrading endonuclease RelE of RelBE toxin-antitoxin system